MCGWVKAVLTSALCWGGADTLFDVIVDAHSEVDESNLPIKEKQKL